MPRKRRDTIARVAHVARRHRAGLSAEPVIRSIGLEEFVRRLRVDTTAEKHFALFLGAGCSVTSGIPSAGALVRDRWIPRLRDYQAPHRSDLDNWATEVIQGYDKTNPDLSYGELIYQLFLTPEDRQREIEDLCDGRTPSFGYAVLAQLVAQPGGRFNSRKPRPSSATTRSSSATSVRTTTPLRRCSSGRWRLTPRMPTYAQT